MSSIDKITSELEGLGYTPFCCDTQQGRTVFIRYPIPTGKYSGEVVLLGFSFQEEGYPEYPPHWIHISPPYDDGHGGGSPYQCQDNHGLERECLALSRPPGSLWDRLATKHMKYYLNLHITRFCKNLK